MEKQGYPPTEHPPSYNSIAGYPSDQMYPQMPEPAQMQPYVPAQSPGYPSAPTPGYPSAPTPGYPSAPTPGYPSPAQSTPAQGYQPVSTDADQPSKVYQPNQPQPAIPVPPSQIMMTPLVGPSPTRLSCPQCGNQITTRVEREIATMAHIIAGILCILGAWCCCCIPYCLDSCKVANHYCPGCGAFLGSYRR